MANCYSLANIDEAISCADLDNLAGVVQEIIYGYWDDVDGFPDLPSPGQQGDSMTFEQAGTWGGDLFMKEGKCAYKLVGTEGSAVLTITDQGEEGGHSVRYQLDIDRAKMNAVIFGFENATRGRRLFLIVTDKNGVSYLMGDKNTAARRVPADASTTGQRADSDVNRVPLRFQYDCPRKLVYQGDKVEILTPKNE
jgi:hypothetical protein